MGHVWSGRGVRRLGLALVGILALGQAEAGADASAPGPFEAGRTRVTVERPNGEEFTALLYYPATQAGNDTPFDGSGGPYAGVSFGHGFLQQPTIYDSTLRHLATHGFLVIATESYTGFFPNHSLYADDLLHCLTWLERADADAGSALFGAVDTGAFGLSGHSMGGGASVLAAARDGRVRAVANLAAAETNPSAIDAMGRVRVPVSLLSGSEDSITPPGQHQEPMYGAGSAPRQLPSLLGGSHCGFLDSNVIFCDSGSLPRAEQLALTRRLLTEFFALHLRGEQGVWSAVWGPGALDDPRVSLTRDSGVEVEAPGGVWRVRAGSGGSFAAVVRNTGPVATALAPVLEGSPWAWGADPGVTEPLAPGESREVRISMVPGPDQAGEAASVLVTARREADGGTRGFAGVDVEVVCPADWNLDGLVNTQDVLAYLNAWSAGDGEADLNGDGRVDTLDVLAFLNLYADGC
jgi:dienelactone hydrolase